VLDEVVLSRASTLQACEEFHARYPNHQAGIVIYGDASGQRLQTAGTTDYQIIKEYFRRTAYRNLKFRVPASNPSVRERVALVNAKLFSADEEVRLLVHPRCTGLVADFEEVTFKPDTSVIDKERDSKRTHLSDALGYLIWQEYRPSVVRRAKPKAHLDGERTLMNIGNVGPDIITSIRSTPRSGDVEAVSRSLRGGSAVHRQRRSVPGSPAEGAWRRLCGTAEPELLRELRRLDCGLVYGDAFPAGAGSELEGNSERSKKFFGRVCGRLRPERARTSRSSSGGSLWRRWCAARAMC
jgi:hypothetical protein